MSFKIMAIGILALLALSSVMNPKAFRFLAGAVAVAIVTLVTGYFVLANYPPTREAANQGIVARAISKLSGVVKGQPIGNDTARSTSQRILQGFEHDLIETDPLDDLLDEKPPQPFQERPRRDRIIVIERHAIETNKTGREDQEQQVGAKLLAIVDQYLKEFKKRNHSPEVARVQATDLNVTLLGFHPKLSKGGKVEYTVVFDERFNQHVIARARQLKMRDRLVGTTYACFGVGVAMLLLFGVLKVINSRKRVLPERDLLRLSEISIV